MYYIFTCIERCFHNREATIRESILCTHQSQKQSEHSVQHVQLFRWRHYCTLHIKSFTLFSSWRSGLFGFWWVGWFGVGFGEGWLLGSKRGGSSSPPLSYSWKCIRFETYSVHTHTHENRLTRPFNRMSFDSTCSNPAITCPAGFPARKLPISIHVVRQ